MTPPTPAYLLARVERVEKALRFYRSMHSKTCACDYCLQAQAALKETI